MAITISGLAREIRKKTGLVQSDVEDVLRALSKVIVDAYVNDQEVRIKGLGIFMNKKIEQRTYATLKNIPEVTVGAHKRPIFVPTQVLEEAIKKRTLEPVKSVSKKPRAIRRTKVG